MYAVVAVYPSGYRILVGIGRTVNDANDLIADCIDQNGKERLDEMGIHFDVELAG